MAKANKKAQDLKMVNTRFDDIAKSLEGYADATEALMPLVADSLRFTRKLVLMYKQAFNAGLKDGS